MEEMEEEEEEEGMSVTVVHVEDVWSSKHCCFGCISVRQATSVIGLVELLVLVILQLQFASFALSDGKIFYTNYFLGEGRTMLTSSLIFTAFSIFVIGMMLLGIQIKKLVLILPHVFWQLGVLLLLGYFLILLYKSMLLNNEDEMDKKILFQSGVVLFIFYACLFVTHLWFLVIVLISCYHLHFSRSTLRTYIGAVAFNAFAPVNWLRRNSQFPRRKSRISQDSS